jgi:hypothetical protein
MATQDFRVYVSGGTVTLDDWGQAMAAPEEQLPELDEAQKEAAKFVRMGEQKYARGVLAEQLGKKRQEEKGRRLGELIGSMLERTADGWILDSLVRKGAELKWIARFTAEGRGREVEIPLELADDAVDSSDRYSRIKLEEILKQRLDLVTKQVSS